MNWSPARLFVIPFRDERVIRLLRRFPDKLYTACVVSAKLRSWARFRLLYLITLHDNTRVSELELPPSCRFLVNALSGPKPN